MTELLNVFSGGLKSGSIIPPAKYEAILLYGGAGSGKTHFALSASELEKYSPMLVVDTENSTSGVIDNFRQRDPDDITNIAFDPEKGGIVDVVRPIEQWGSKAYEHTMVLLDQVASGNTIYKSIVIDVADVLQAWGLDYHEDPKNSYAKWSSIDADLTGAPLPNKIKGGTNLGLFYRLKMSGVLTFLVVHEKRVPQEEGPDEIQYQWGGQGKGKLGGIPDAVFYFKRKAQNGGAVTTMSTVSKGNFEAKNRFGLPNDMKNPTFKDVLEASEKTSK